MGQIHQPDPAQTTQSHPDYNTTSASVSVSLSLSSGHRENCLDPPAPAATTTFKSELSFAEPGPSSRLHLSIAGNAHSPRDAHCLRSASMKSSDNGSDNSGMDPHPGYHHGQDDTTNSEYHQSPQEHDKHESGSQHENRDLAPSWAELKTKAGKDRKRLPLACIACRRKKIRCSGEKPACKHCLRSRIPCVYKVTTRKAAPRTDYMAMLDKRLKRMEDRVIKIIPKEEAGNIQSGGRAVLKPSAANAQKNSVGNKRSAEDAFGAQLDSWAETSAVSSRATPKPPPAIPREDAIDDKKLLSEGAESLPAKEIQEHLAEVYFDYVYGQGYPLLHKPSYMRRLAAGTVPPVLVLAVCAISARFSSHPRIPTEGAPFLRGECWAKPAREIALKRYDQPNITILIVYLILGLHEFATCQGGRSWMLGGMAQRMAYALQLHHDYGKDSLGQRSSKSEMSFTDREIRRRTMWSCFLMDRFNSSGTQRPMFANEQYLKLQLPIKEHFFQMEIPGPVEDLDGNAFAHVPAGRGLPGNAHANTGVTAYIIRAVAFWGRLIQYMNLGGRDDDQYPMWSPQSAYHKLHEQVVNFERTLPESLKYTPENLQNHASERTANQFLYLHIICKQLILFNNRFAFPATANARQPKDIPIEFLTNARKAALESATAISKLVDEGMVYRLVVPFVGYCAYLSSAVHIHGIFSRQPQLEESAKENLTINIKFLSKMKKYWGMFHFLTESLRDIYRQHADLSVKGISTSGSRNGPKSAFQYGDWYDRYPRGVSQTDYEDPVADVKKEAGTDAVLGEKSDLQSVEEFFATLSPKTKTKHRSKVQRQHRNPSSQNPNIPYQLYPNQPPQRMEGLRSPNQSFSHSHIAVPQSPASFGYPESYDRSPIQQQLPPPRQPQMIPFDQSPQQPQEVPIQHTSGMSQLEQQLILNSYNVMDPALAPQHIDNNVWDVDFSGLGDDFFSNENGSAWFMPFNLPLPDESAPFSAGAGMGWQDFGLQGRLVQGDVDMNGEMSRPG